MSGICESGLMLMFKKFGILGALSELLEPHLFGRTGALKFGTIGVHPVQLGVRLFYLKPALAVSAERTSRPNL